jgi:RIO kinase 1
MDNPLGPLLDEGIISEVLGRLQSGKEAEVFIVRYAERVVAAKVYKDRSQRSFKNKSAYQEGRGVRNSRDQRAIGKRSSFGRDTEEDAWKSAEVDAMYKLHAADVRIPEPVLFFEGVLLMDLVLDAEGVTARRLIDTTLSAEQANAAYHDMLVQLVRMLSCDLIHGDLSPYNVLWAAAGPTIIDFPQIVSAAQNSNSERFFMRDAENILGHFRALDPRLDTRRGDAAEIWRAYMRRELTSDFMPTGRLQRPPPQKPLPIGGSRPGAGPPLPQPQRGFRAPPSQARDGRPPQQSQQRDGRPPQAQPNRNGGPPQAQQRDGRPPQPQRDGRPPQPQRDGRPPQQQRDGRPPQPQRDGRPPQQQRDGRQQQSRGGQQQRGGRPAPQQRDGGNGPQQQRHAARPSGHAQTRRTAPEVIVRPRVAPGAPPRAPRPAEPTAPAVASERTRKPESQRD